MKRSFLLLTLVLAACGGGGGGGGATHGALPTLGAPAPQATPLATTKRSCASLAATPKGHVTCFAVVRTDVGGMAPRGYHGSSIRSAQSMLAPTGASGNPLGPAQLQSAYNFPSSIAGKGQTIAIVDAYANPTLESDLKNYRSQFGLPPCTSASGCLKIVNQSGNAWPLPSSDAGWGLEESLDVDMVSAICPNCNIVAVSANSNNLTDLEAAENAAVALGARYISNSYGGPEVPPADDPAFNHAGVVITASTGDGDWFAGVAMPAAFANVISVGGTSLYAYKNARGWLEAAWEYGGSGCSQVVLRPGWQKRVGCEQTGFDGKALADISAMADPYPGVWVYDSGWDVVGGTSASSPIVAAGYALAGNALTSTPGGASIWANAGSAYLNDVTMGNNGVYCVPLLICHAGPGYDGPSGWGSPNGIGAL